MKWTVSLMNEDRTNGIDGEFTAPTAEAAIEQARERWNALEELFPVAEVSPA